MIDFLREYKEVIVGALAVILSIISLIIKKRPITEIIDESWTSKLITFVNEAEAKFKRGSDKLNYVIERFKERYPKEYAEIDSFEKKSFGRFGSADDEIRSCVEFILTTPQKKGVK